MNDNDIVLDNLGNFEITEETEQRLKEINDIQIDSVEIYYTVDKFKKLEANLDLFVNSLDTINKSDELSSIDLTKLKNSIDEVKSITLNLEETKNLMTNLDVNVKFIYDWCDAGYIDENGNVLSEILYDQLNYKDSPYVYDNIAASGCGITSLAMYLTMMTGKIVTPDELALLSRSIPDYGSPSGMLDKMMAKLELNYEKAYVSGNVAENKERFKNHLSQGKAIICLVKGSSHFVLLYGINENGNVMVLDPYGPYVRRHSVLYETGVSFDNLADDNGLDLSWGNMYLLNEDVKLDFANYVNGDPSVNELNNVINNEFDSYVK